MQLTATAPIPAASPAAPAPAPILAADRDRWNAPLPTPQLEGSVARISTRFGMNFMAGAWVDVFAKPGEPFSGRVYASFADAVGAARELTTGAAPALGIFADSLEQRFELRELVTPDVWELGDDQATATRVAFTPETDVSSTDGHVVHYPKVAVGVLATDPLLRGIVDGELLPTVSTKG